MVSKAITKGGGLTSKGILYILYVVTNKDLILDTGFTPVTAAYSETAMHEHQVVCPLCILPSRKEYFRIALEYSSY